MKTNRHAFSFSLLTVSLLTATSAMAAGYESPFSIPLYLTNPGGMGETRIVRETTPETKFAYLPNCPVVEKVKPNIVLYIDDSSSMNARLGGSSNTKIQMLRNVISKVMASYGDDVTWSVAFMNQSNRDLALGATGSDVSNTINRYNIPGGQGTSLLNGYTRAIDKLNGVQTNNKYVVVLTDGAANGGSVNDINRWLRNSNIGSSLGTTYDLDGYDVEDFAALGRDINPSRSSRYYARSYGFANDWQYNLCQGTDKTECPTQVSELDTKYLRQLSEPLEQKANIVTFTVAFGLSGGADYRYFEYEDYRTRYMLEKGASGGGNYNNMKTAFTADKEDELLAAFDQIIGSVVSRHDQDITSSSQLGTPQYGNKPNPGSSITSVVKVDQHALAPVARPNGDQLYAQEFAALWLPIQEEGGLRSAELRFYETQYQFANNDKDNGLITGVSTPNYTVPLFPDDRKAYVTDKDFSYTRAAAKQMFAREFYKNNTYFNLNARNSKDSDEWQNALMPWISRKDKTGNAISDADIIKIAQEHNYTENVEEYRKRTKYQMGDILESDIVTIGDFVDGDPKTGYNGRREFITAAANDGLAYIFQSNGAVKQENGKNPYTLKMTYAPTALQREKDETVAHRYQDIANSQYALDGLHPHVYMLSGGITAHTLEEPFRIDYVIGNAGRGAKGLYGLNLTAISKEQGFNNPQKVPLFEAGAHRGGEESGMGYTIGYPSTARFGKNVVKPNNTNRPDLSLDNGIHIMTAVGSGFTSKTELDKQETTMYLYDTLGGADVGIKGDTANSMANIGKRNTVGALANSGKKIKVSDTNTGGLATPNLLDVNMDGVVDYAFAGDYSGNMYRCDVRDYDNVRCSMIFKGDPKRPITSAPIAVQMDWEYVIIWGTGSDLFEADLQDTNTQAIYGIYQQFDPMTLNITKEYDKVANKLLQQKFETPLEKNGKQFRNIALDKDNQPMGEYQPGKGLFYNGEQYDGWVLDLEHGGAGERIVTQPILSNRTVYFASRVYGSTSATKNIVPWNDGWTKADWEANNWKTESTSAPIPAGLCSDKESDKLNGGGGWAKDWTPVQDTTGLPQLDVSCVWKQKTCEDKVTVEYTVTAKDDPGSYTLTSSLIQLKAENGGRIYPKKDITSYVIMDYDEGSSNAYGYQGDGSIMATESYMGLISLSHNNPNNKYNVDISGNYGHTGSYTKLGGGTKSNTQFEQRENNCAPDDGKMSSALNITMTKGFDTKLMKHHFVVANCLRRISWREIY